MVRAALWVTYPSRPIPPFTTARLYGMRAAREALPRGSITSVQRTQQLLEVPTCQVRSLKSESDCSLHGACPITTCDAHEGRARQALCLNSYCSFHGNYCSGAMICQWIRTWERTGPQLLSYIFSDDLWMVISITFSSYHDKIVIIQFPLDCGICRAVPCCICSHAACTYCTVQYRTGPSSSARASARASNGHSKLIWAVHSAPTRGPQRAACASTQ